MMVAGKGFPTIGQAIGWGVKAVATPTCPGLSWPRDEPGPHSPNVHRLLTQLLSAIPRKDLR